MLKLRFSKNIRIIKIFFMFFMKFMLSEYLTKLFLIEKKVLLPWDNPNAVSLRIFHKIFCLPPGNSLLTVFVLECWFVV